MSQLNENLLTLIISHQSRVLKTYFQLFGKLLNKPFVNAFWNIEQIYDLLFTELRIYELTQMRIKINERIKKESN